ncbi:hypothetical protein [Dyella ginsengisoli]|uniref:hypothetical protein n=1 Tax=Dyella ginsengisoli TaxID=363848 RepID=UPI00034871F4|nr:hypothetical protein [Dyella ginsengisoli]
MPLPSARFLVAANPVETPPSWLAPDPRCFARDLAALGPVFCAWAGPAADLSAGAPDIASGSPDGLVLAHPGLLAHACAVTIDGPREWITVHDRAGKPRCRLYLLPDTDYLAWDALLAHADATVAPAARPRWRAHRGRRLRFEVESIGPWSLVCTSTALPDCVLSWRTVRELVRTEGVALVA